MMQLSSAIIGKTECLKTSLCPSQLSAFMVAQGIRPPVSLIQLRC
jgi:hypothetical protein